MPVDPANIDGRDPNEGGVVMENSMDPVEIVHTADTTHVALQVALGAADARRLYEKLGAALANATAIVMDGERVERIDSAALQVLANFCRAARERGVALVWQNPSTGLQQAAQNLGLQTILEMTP